METQKPTEKELLDGVVDRLLKDYKKPEDIIGENGLLKQLIKAVPTAACFRSGRELPSSQARAGLCAAKNRPALSGAGHWMRIRIRGGPAAVSRSRRANCCPCVPASRRQTAQTAPAGGRRLGHRRHHLRADRVAEREGIDADPEERPAVRGGQCHRLRPSRRPLAVT